MADAPLDPEATALWRRVADTVRPLKERRGKSPYPSRQASVANPNESDRKQAQRGGRPVSSGSQAAGLRQPLPPRGGEAQNTLDANWDKRLRQGAMAPDVTIDLHGYTVAAAHGALEAELAQAVARRARLVLLITGRPPPPGRSRLDNPLRGVIRASIGDWLHHSRHAPHIAAVRNAHPRHGGAGALYVVLRRPRR